MVLGAILAVLLILFAVVAVHGMADDRTSKGYADTATLAIVSDWNEQALLDRASPDFIKVTTREQIDSLFARLRALGRMTKYAGSLGDSFTSFNIFPWKLTTTAVYVVKADFEHGSAQIKITLIKRDGAWRILGFYVQGKGNQESPAKWRVPVYLLYLSLLRVEDDTKGLRPKAGACRIMTTTSLPPRIGLTPATIPWTNRGVRC